MKSPRPPRLAERIFQWYCERAMIEDLHGDLEELFFLNLQTMSPLRAKWHYWRDTISLMFSYAVKRRKSHAAIHAYSQTNGFAMLQNYFKIAVRTLAKQKFFTTINVIGLSIGMSICLLLVAMLSFTFRYDNFQTNHDRIYRVTTLTDDLQRNLHYASSPMQLGEMMKHDLPAIEEVVRINNGFAGDVVVNNQKIALSGYFTDPSFLKVFSFPLLKGNPETALSKMNNVLLTESAAKKLFGDDEPVGKIVSMGDLGDYEVAGILKDHPRNTHLYFEAIAPYDALVSYQRNHPLTDDPLKVFRGNYNYFLMPDDAFPETVADYLSDVAPKLYKDKKNFKASFELQAMDDITPGPNLANSIGPEWDYASFGIFGFLTMMILLPACFNYASISMSRALKRSKEFGLRKVVGGQRGQIFMQFIVETVVVSLLALAGASLLFTMLKGEFMAMLASAEGISLDPDFITALCFIVFALFVGFAAGIVPALYFSKVNPVQAFKGNLTSKALSGLRMRKVLIVSQFAISLGFIMAVVIVLNQYRATLNYNFGFNQENILDVELKDVNPQIFRNEFARLGEVQSVSMSSGVLGTAPTGDHWLRKHDSDSIQVYDMSVDQQFINNMGLTLIAGKSFGVDERADQQNVVVNEEFLRQFGVVDPSVAPGITVETMDGKELHVIGVMKDFHYASLREKIGAFFLRYDPSQFNYANLKMNSGDMSASVDEMQAIWNTFKTEEKFMARFFDDELEEAYDFYFSMIKICGSLGILAISVSCLGLLGMVVYTVETRTKEVGVRKVMGASDNEVLYLLSADFLKLMLIAAVIAIPITYILFDKVFLRLQSSYPVAIGFVEIFLSIAIMLFLGGMTVFSQTMKAARSKPVDTLRYE